MKQQVAKISMDVFTTNTQLTHDSQQLLAKKKLKNLEEEKKRFLEEKDLIVANFLSSIKDPLTGQLKDGYTTNTYPDGSKYQG